MAQLVEHFPGTHEALGFNMVGWHTSAIPALEQTREKDQNLPGLHSKFKSSLDYMRPCFQKGNSWARAFNQKAEAQAGRSL